MGKPEVGICTGKDCRRAGGFRTVERQVSGSCDVLELKCLEVCDGVVVVLEPRSKNPVVLERIRNRALAIEIVEHVVDGEPLTGRLRKRRLSGAKRNTARRRLARSL